MTPSGRLASWRHSRQLLPGSKEHASKEHSCCQGVKSIHGSCCQGVKRAGSGKKQRGLLSKVRGGQLPKDRAGTKNSACAMDAEEVLLLRAERTRNQFG